MGIGTLPDENCSEELQTDIMQAQRLEIEEIGGDKYRSLEEPQTAALPHLAALVASIVRQGIEDGSFVVVDGVARLAQPYEPRALANQRFTNGKKGV